MPGTLPSLDSDDPYVQDAFSEVIAAVQIPPPTPGLVTILGQDPVFQTRYRIGTAAAAALAGTGLAASRLWALRSGHEQRLNVDVRAAAASLRSVFYLEVNGVRAQEMRDPLHGFYSLHDGRFIYLHCNFPAHRDAVLKVLAVANDKTAVTGAIARFRDGVALEDAIHAAGGCAGYVRTPDEWRIHPQAQSLRTEPLLEILRIDNAPPRPLPDGDRPLSGIRALDLTRVLAGPSSTRLLAEHGADVLRVTAPHMPDLGDFELDTGLGKLSAHIDLRSEIGLAMLRQLAGSADMFVQSYRPGALAARGLGPEDLARLRPGIVYVSLDAWGYRGPWRSRRGFDSVVQAVSGMAHVSGTEGRPANIPAAAIDYVAGDLMAFGAMAALHRRATVGGSWHVRVSLARVGQWIAERGLVDPAEAAAADADLTPEELAGLRQETVTPVGTISHLGPIVQMAETPSHWARPSVPPGMHAAEWPPLHGGRPSG